MAAKSHILSSTLGQVANQAPLDSQNITTTTAFPLWLKYLEEEYHKILTSSLTEGSPLLMWSKKVAQWNSKLNGFCYLKQFTWKSQVTIANILGPFPKGKDIKWFEAFEHNNAQKFQIDHLGPQSYHYW